MSTYVGYRRGRADYGPPRIFAIFTCGSLPRVQRRAFRRAPGPGAQLEQSYVIAHATGASIVNTLSLVVTWVSGTWVFAIRLRRALVTIAGIVYNITGTPCHTSLTLTTSTACTGPTSLALPGRLTTGFAQPARQVPYSWMTAAAHQTLFDFRRAPVDVSACRCFYQLHYGVECEGCGRGQLGRVYERGAQGAPCSISIRQPASILPSAIRWKAPTGISNEVARALHLPRSALRTVVFYCGPPVARFRRRRNAAPSRFPLAPCCRSPDSARSPTVEDRGFLFARAWISGMDALSQDAPSSRAARRFPTWR